MSELRRYPDYKNSGVPWLGDIPSHWEAKRMRFFVNTNPLKSELGIQEGLLVSFVPMESVAVDGGLTLTTDKEISDVYKGYTYFRNDDVVMAKITPCFENGKASICNNLTNDIGFGTTELHVLRPKEETSSRFLFYLIRSDVFMKIGESEMYGAGGQKRVPESFIKNFVAPLPDIREQQAIVNFLDDKLNHIDTLISKQQQLIEKLAEQRSAVITHAVTKGLDPNVPMKDSGVEWLGEIPKHWDLTPVRRVTSYVGSGKTPKGGAEVYVDDGIMMIRSQNVYDDGLRLDNVIYITEEAHDQQANTEVLPEDVLLNITGASLGRVTIAPKNIAKANVNQHVCILRSINNKIEPEFLKLLFQSLYFKTLVKADENGSSREGLNFQQIKAMKLALPSLMEQRKIVHFVYAELSTLDRMSKATKDIINKLQEYRAALITQAVTGKIDVRYLNQQAS